LRAKGEEKLAKTKTKSYGVRQFAGIKANSTAGRPRYRQISKGGGTGLMLMVPVDTLRMLRIKAAETGTTVRALVLEALRKSGYSVPADELVDRRRRL